MIKPKGLKRIPYNVDHEYWINKFNEWSKDDKWQVSKYKWSDPELISKGYIGLTLEGYFRVVHEGGRDKWICNICDSTPTLVPKMIGPSIEDSMLFYYCSNCHKGFCRIYDIDQ